VTAGAITGGATTTQANGFLRTYMKLSGYDGLIFQGRSDRWVYICLHKWDCGVERCILPVGRVAPH